jgi:hypothetical protein
MILQYARKVNHVGELHLVVEDDPQVNKVFVPENRIEVWRTKNGASKLDMGGVWFIHTISRMFDTNGSSRVEIEAHDQIGVLGRRIIPYNEGNPTTEKQGDADDVMKNIVIENMGADATDTDRDLRPYLTVQGYEQTVAPQVTKFIAKDNVYDVLLEIAETSYDSGTFLAFDLVYNPNSGTFEFRTFLGQRGVDRSVQGDAEYINVGVEYGSFDSATLVDSRVDEKNYIYAGAKDLVGIVPPVETSDSFSIGLSPFNRKELFYNASNADDSVELESEAFAALENNKYSIRMEATLSQEFAQREYGERLMYGDKVSISFYGQTYTAYVNAIGVTVDQKGEKIDVVMIGENE